MILMSWVSSEHLGRRGIMLAVDNCFKIKWIFNLTSIYFMSVVLKTNELNTLIYKYLLEAGLSHTAYSLFNEAALAQPLQEYRFDVRPGHLLSILQKGLIYAKIQAHVTFSQYMDCNESFYLLKPHTCKVIEKVKKERLQANQQLQEQISEGLKRTNSMYNTAMANRDIQESAYEAKGKKFVQKFPKIGLPSNEPNTSNSSGRYLLGGTDIYTLLYNPNSCEIDLLKYDLINQSISLQKMMPSIKMGELSKSVDESITNQQIIQLFEGNHITIFDLRNQAAEPLEFTIPSQLQLTKIDPNPHIPQLVCFKNDSYFTVLNINSLTVVASGVGEFYWRIYDEFMLINDTSINLYCLELKDPIRSFSVEIKWEDIKFNASKNLFAVVSYLRRVIHVYTFESTQPLFTFQVQDNIQRQVLFVTSNGVDYICWFTSEIIKIFDLSINGFSKIIDIRQYDYEIKQICVLLKADKDQLYLLALASENMLLYDISNAKVERIQIEAKVWQLKQLSLSRVAMVTDTNIYFLVGRQIDLLFK